MKACKIRITKKTQSASLPDIMKIIENYEKEEDDYFWYIDFKEGDTSIQELFNIAGGWKTTKMWIEEEEIPKYERESYESTMLCKYREKCQGICLHGLDMWISNDWDDTDRLEETGESNNIKVLSEWIKNLETIVRRDFFRNNYFMTFEELIKQEIMVKEEGNSFFIQKELLIEFIMSKLQFELQYCSSISRESILDFIENIPNTLNLPNFILEHIGSHIENETFDKENEEEFDFIKEQAKAFGDEVEERIRKVLSEFFDKK